MSGPWEDYKKSEATKESLPWEDFSKTEAVPSDVRKERLLTDYIPDENTLAALTAGLSQGAALDYAPNISAGLTDPANYVEARDRIQKGYSQLQKTNPLMSTFGKAVGGILPAMALPLTKMAQGGKLLGQMAGMAGEGLLTGAAVNPGNVEGEVTPLQLKQRVDNANTGALLSTLIGTGVKGITSLPEIGMSLKDKAAKMAYLSSSPKLADRRVDAATGMDKELGRYMLDTGYVELFGSTASVAEKAGPRLEQVGSKLDKVYLEAGEKFKDAANKPGYDPIRDKAEVMQAAKTELGDAEGATSALRRLSRYLDEISAKHGDAPNQASMYEYKKQVSDYAKEYKDYLKNKKAYTAAVGTAGADVTQPVLAGSADDLQRTVNKDVQIELPGWADSPKQDLFAMQNTPKKSTTAQLPSIVSEEGQTSMIFPPNAPTRPVRPEQVRNPMSPRRMNDIKGAMDDVINYERNPLTGKDPATEKAFYGARTAMSGKIDKAIEELGGEEAFNALKEANKAYQMESKIKKYSTDQMSRNDVNKPLGLTDTIMAVRGLPELVAKKAGEKFGYQTGAAVLDPVGTFLMRTPEISNKFNPEITNVLLQRYLMMNQGE